MLSGPGARNMCANGSKLRPLVRALYAVQRSPSQAGADHSKTKQQATPCDTMTHRCTGDTRVPECPHRH